MNIEPDIFDYLQTTSLEPHDDYTSEITYKDQKIIWNRLQEKDKEIERLKSINEEHRILNGMIRKELQQKENIIKEAREHIEENCYKKMGGYGDNEDDDIEVCLFEDDIWELREILDKEK